jgi:tetratricopeptide (TPR) repeat protein
MARLPLLLAASLAVTSCARCQNEAPPAPKAAAPEKYPWALAIDDPGGNTPVDDVVRDAQKKVKQVPKSDDRTVELGRAWILKARHSGDPGYYLHAAACAQRVLDRDPKNRLAHELFAQVFNSQHEFKAAVAQCEEVFKTDPEAVITLGVYSDALFELGRVEEAMAAADKMVSVKPNTASYVRVAFFQWFKGDANAALETSKLAIQASNDPSQPEPRAYALVQAANFFFSRGDYPGADAGYQQALDIFPGYAPALAGRGRVAMAMNEPARAVPLFQEALAAIPLVDTAWRLGDARLAAGDAAGAAEAWKQVETLGKKDPRTLAAFLAAKAKDLPRALELVNAELEVRPGPYTQDVLAWASYRAGKLDAAKSAIIKVSQGGTKDPLLLFHLGAIELATGDAKNGPFHLKEALALSPAFDPLGAAEAKKLLASAETR